MDIDLPAVETVRLCISDYVNCFFMFFFFNELYH